MSKFKPSALGNVYAKALIELAGEQGQLEVVAQEAAALEEVVAASADLRNLFANPALAKANRDDAMRRIFDGRVSPLVLRFLLVVSAHGRLAQLGEILASVQQAIAHLRGEVDVLVTVPAALDAAASAALRTEIAKALGKQVNLACKTDPAILGGMTLRVGDQLIDASVSTRLRKMRASLTRAANTHAKAAAV